MTQENTQPIALIYNPSAGGGKALRRKKKVENSLQTRGIQYDLFVTESEDHLVETAAKVVHTHPVIIGAGGDTTLNFIATQVLRQGTGNVLGIISLGSVNDLAREIGVHKLENASDAIKYNAISSIDVGMVSSEKNPGPYYFLVSASLGLGVTVNRYVDIWMRKHPLCANFRSATQGTAALSAVHQAFKNHDVPLKLTLEAGSNRQLVEPSLMIFSNTS